MLTSVRRDDDLVKDGKASDKRAATALLAKMGWSGWRNEEKRQGCRAASR